MQKHQTVIVRDLQVRLVPIDQLIPNIRNSRTHTDEQVAKLTASIREFGWTNPLLIGLNRVIIAGHARWLAGQKLGLTEVPVIELNGLTEAQCRALAIVDNQLAISGAGWDEDLLRLELTTLREESFEISLIGFDDEELAHLLTSQEAAEGLVDDDEIPEILDLPISLAGDLWLLGNHRFLCGDATLPADVEHLIQPTWCSLIRPITSITRATQKAS